MLDHPPMFRYTGQSHVLREELRKPQTTRANERNPQKRGRPCARALCAITYWLFARHQRGAMILRIEDTDAERNKPELVQGIIDGLHWLGVDWDEGPFYQSQRTALYQAAGKKLLASGSAFLCYCPAERYAGGDHAVEAQDDEPKASGPRRIVRCTCRDGKPSTPGTRPAVRFRVPTGGATKFFDAIFGE